jgi:pimeloyl-ACP methyl ester carboxylesterase
MTTSTTATPGFTDERLLEVWGARVRPRVLVAGDGPPLVYLHAVFGLAWDPFIETLAQTHTVYAPEHPGTSPGDPDAAKPLDDLWDLVLYYDEVLDALGLEQAALVGHSFGAMVAAELAAHDPRRVSKMVLLSPIGLWRDDLGWNNPLTMDFPTMGKHAFADPDGPVARAMLTLPEDPDAQVEAIVGITWSMATTAKFFWPLPDRGLHKRLHRVTAPTLVVWGEQDGIVSPAYADEFARRIRGARAEILPRAGHVPQLERLDAVGPMVTEFLRS